MNSLGKKTGYVKGLLEGLTFSDPAQEKLLQAIVDLLGEICDQVESMDDMLDELNDYVESIDDDLSELEDERDDDFHSLDDDDFEDEDYLDDAATPDRLHLIGGKADEDDEEDDEDDEDLDAVLCPDCLQPFFVTWDDPEDAVYVCPHCGHKVIPTPLTLENAPIARRLTDDNDDDDEDS